MKTFTEFCVAVATVKVEDVSAGGDDYNAQSHLGFGSRPHYYDSLDDSAEKLSVPAMASGFIKTEPSSSNEAVYNSVAKKLMVYLIIFIRFIKILNLTFTSILCQKFVNVNRCHFLNKYII